MLHILWLILKFILIILGILLGLLLLAVLFVLFCPVRYRVSAVKTEGDWKQTEGEGIVSWLFHGISLKAEWKDQQMEISFHLFGIPVDKLLKKRQEKRTVTEKSGTGVNREEENKKSENIEAEDLRTDRNSASGTSADTERTGNSQIFGQQRLNTDDISEDTLKKRQFFIKRIRDRFRNIFQSIRTKLRNIRRTFRKIKKEVSWWKAFIEHPRVTAARKLVWKHGKFLFKHVFPTKIEGQVTFSFEDPAVTGATLAVLGMTIPFHKNCVQINPRFEGENYLQGNIRAKGRIYGFVFARAAVSIYFNKNIKYVIKRWKTRRA